MNQLQLPVVPLHALILGSLLFQPAYVFPISTAITSFQCLLQPHIFPVSTAFTCLFNIHCKHIFPLSTVTKSFIFSFALCLPTPIHIEYLNFQERVRDTVSLCPVPPYPQCHALCSCLAQASVPAFKSENRQPTYWPGMPHQHEWLASLHCPKGAGQLPDISQAAGLLCDTVKK